MLKKLITAFGMIGLLAFAAPSMADLNYTLDVEIGGTDDGGSATVTFDNFVDGTSQVTFDVTVVNTTTVVPGGALTSLAWLVPVNVTDMNLDGQSSTDFIEFRLCFDQTIQPDGTDSCDASISPITTVFDACLLTGNSDNCTGGNVADGLAAGYTAVFTITVDLNPDLTATEFEAALKAAIEGGVSTGGNDPIEVFGICARFQGLGERDESDKKCAQGGDTPVPEPGTLGLLGLGLLGMGLARRRRIAA